MAITANFTYGGVPELSQRVLQKLVREALVLALNEWKATDEPKHFTNKAVGEYGYQKRSKGYQIRKARATHQTAALVYSGNAKRMALGSNKITTRGNQATLSINVPDYWQYVKSSHPDMSKELTTVTAAEQTALVAKMDEHLQRLINAKLSR
jgi:hypothetical protein